MRWKGLILILLLLVGMFILAGIFTDTWLESRIEKSFTQINGALVEIDNLDFSIVNSSLGWDKIQITDPSNTMKNMIETGRCNLDLALLPLFYRDIVINNIEISEFEMGTQREHDGKIALQKKRKQTKKESPGVLQTTSQRLNSELKNYSNLRLQNMKSKINTDSLMNQIDLQSVKLIASLEKEYEEKYTYWKNEINSIEAEKDFEALKKDYNKINQINPQKIKSLEEAQESIEIIQSAHKNLTNISDKVNRISNKMSDDLKAVKINSEDLQNTIQKDYENIKSKARLPSLGRKNITNFIFGKEMVNRINGYLDIVSRIKNYYNKITALKSDKEKETEPERFEGQDIKYSGKYNFPSFWIKNIDLSGRTGNRKLSGKITNIVSDQNLIDAPLKIKLQNKQTNGRSFAFVGTLDKRTNQVKDNFAINLTDFPLKEAQISQSELFPYKVNRGQADINGSLEIINNEFDGKLDFKSKKLDFTRTKNNRSDTKVNSIIADIVEDLDRLEIGVDIKGTAKNTEFNLSSNVDKIFNDKIKSIVNDEIKSAQKKLENRVDQEVNLYKKQLNSRIASDNKQLKKQFEKYEENLQKYEDQFDKKEKELKDRITKLGKEKLKDLF